MKYNYDPKDILDYFEKIVAVPSPVSYYVQMNPVIEQLAAQLGLQVTFDHKQTAYIALEGQDNSKTVLVGAHLDTLGLVVRCIDADGMIRVRQLGRRLDLCRVHPHKFRRPLATRAIEKSMPVEQVQRLLGHSKIETTMEYAMVDQCNVKNSHRRYLS